MSNVKISRIESLISVNGGKMKQLLRLFCVFYRLSRNVKALATLYDSKPPPSEFLQRRDVFKSLITVASSTYVLSPKEISADDSSISQQNFAYSEEWTGTSLDLLSFQQAASLGNDPSNIFMMGKWPDPILRRPASTVNFADLSSSSAVALSLQSLEKIGESLRRTARFNGAVGLAAQQCAIDISMIFLDDPKILAKSDKLLLNKIDRGGLFLVNPRILARSPEVDMQVWNEECLVLPPTFRATVLRDAQVLVQYENLSGKTQNIQLQGELARAFQHELDHDRGILITDHVGLDELENDTMRSVERQGHDRRQVMAYDRFVSQGSGDHITPSQLMACLRQRIVSDANAEDLPPPANQNGNGFESDATIASPTSALPSYCDEACLQERKRIIQERRAMMMQSKTNTKRSDLFELSKQRATLYGTQYQGATCPPGVPCI
jgi:peptide deformylase